MTFKPTPKCEDKDLQFFAEVVEIKNKKSKSRPATLSRRRLEEGREKTRASLIDHFEELQIAEYERPRTREDCADVPRPCPFVGCRNHLYLDVGQTGAITMNFPDLEPEDLEGSCALDIAEQGETGAETVRGLMNLTNERIGQLMRKVLRKMMDTKLRNFSDSSDEKS